MVSERERPPQDATPTGSRSEIESEVSQEEIEALLKKVDKESTFRKLTGFDHWLVYWIAVAFSCFHVFKSVDQKR